MDLRYYRDERPLRSVPREKREPQAGTVSVYRNTTRGRPFTARAWPACRGLRARRARKQMHGTEEARGVPAALIARAKQEGGRNDKKRRLAFRESDRLIVSSGKAQPRNWRRGRRVGEAHTGNPCRKNDGPNGPTFL